MPTPSPSPTPSPTPSSLPINTFQFIGDQSLKTALTPHLKAAVTKFATDLNAYLDKKYPLTTSASGTVIRAIPPDKITIINTLWRTFQRLAGNPITGELAQKALNELFDRTLDKIIEVLDADIDDKGKNSKKHCIGLYENGNLIKLDPLAKFVAIEFIETDKARANSIAKSFGNYLYGTAIDQIDLGFLNFVSDDYLLPEQKITGIKTIFPVPVVPGELSISILPRIYCGKYQVYQYLPANVPNGESPSPLPTTTPTPTPAPIPIPIPIPLPTG